MGSRFRAFVPMVSSVSETELAHPRGVSDGRDRETNLHPDRQHVSIPGMTTNDVCRATRRAAGRTTRLNWCDIDRTAVPPSQGGILRLMNRGATRAFAAKSFSSATSQRVGDRTLQPHSQPSVSESVLAKPRGVPVAARYLDMPSEQVGRWANQLGLAIPLVSFRPRVSHRLALLDCCAKDFLRF